MDTHSHIPRSFDLEGLEPRLLLSADGISALRLGAAGAGHDAGSAAVVVGTLTHAQPAGASSHAMHSDLFGGMADEALDIGVSGISSTATQAAATDSTISSPSNPVTPTTPVAPTSAGVTADASATTTTTKSGAASTLISVTDASTAGETLGLANATSRTDANTLTDQLTTTLKAANSPPTSTDGSVFGQNLAGNNENISNGFERVRAAAMSGAIEGTEIIAALVTNYTSNKTFSGTTSINISGKSAGQYDQITVGNRATLGGTLAITLTNYTPAEGDTFDIVTAGSFSGHFDIGTGLFGFGDGSLYLKVVQTATKLQLVATKVSADTMLFKPDTKAGADAFGQLLNKDHFTTASATFSGSVTISQFVSIYGTLNLSWVSSLSVTLTDNSSTTVYGLTIGGTGLDVFVGIGGPYLQDSNGDGRITASDTPNRDAAGLHFANVNVGAVLFRSLSLVDYSTYYAVSVTASTGEFVGLDAITAQAKNISVGVNQVRANIDNVLLPAPAIKFSALSGGGLDVAAGGGTSVKLDFSQRFMRASVADLTLQVSQFIYLRGSFAFEKSQSLTVPLAGGGTTQVETMTVGGSGIHVFVGVGGPYWLDSNNDGQITSADTPSTDAVGLALENVSVGLLFAKENSLITPAKYTALKITAASAATVGMSSAVTITAKGITVGYNTVTSATDSALFPEAAIDFSGMTGGGFDVPTGGTPVKLDFTDRIVRASVADLTLQIAKFIYVRGSFAFEKGATLTVPLAGGGSTEVETVTVGASGVHAFVGMSGPYWQDTNNDGQITSADTPSADAIGLALENVNVGFLLAQETDLTFVAKYTALKITAASARTVGMNTALTFNAKDISVGYNTVTSSTDTALTPEAAIDFSSLAGGGLDIATGGTPVKLDFTDRILRASVGDLTLAVAGFIYVRGSFAFEKGNTLTVPLAGGGTTEIETMTVGASGVHVFVGVGGPYWLDSNNDGKITETDTPSADAIGIALQDVNIGLLFAEETALTFVAKYTALKVTAASAMTVGMSSAVNFSAKGISIGYNTATSSTDSALFPEAAINFSAMEGGGFDVPTGGTPVKLDFSDRILRASVADLTLQISQFIYLRGSFAFEKGNTLTVPLAGGGSTEVETVTVGAAGVHVFVGVKGPYWQDTNDDGLLTADDTPMSDSIGLAFENVNVGLLLAKETALTFVAKYTALKIDAASAQTVGMGTVLTVSAKNISVGYNTATSSTDSALFPEAAIDFSRMTGGGLDIPTGGAPVKLDFSDRILRASVADLTVAVSKFIYVRGSFAFEKGNTLTVPLAGGGSTEIETMTIGASGVHVFVGVGGPYWQDTNNDGKITSADTPSGDAVGLALENVNVGFLMAEETDLTFAAKYTALKVTATSARTVGMGSVLNIDAKGITIGYNSADSSTNTALTPEAAIDFSAMTGGGLDVPTGGTLMKLDFSDQIIRASVADLTIAVSQFIFVRGSFAFEKGNTLTVPLSNGSSTEVETMTVGASGVYVFAGLGGPYWVDSNNDGKVTAADTPSTGNAIGLALANVNVGLLIAKETKLLLPAKYTALSVSAATATTVGMGDILTISAKGIDVGFNSVNSPTDTPLTPAPAINFSAMTGGGFDVPTGSTPVKLDFDDAIVRASVADITLQLSEFIYVRGAVAFEKGVTQTVSLVGGLAPDPFGSSKELEFLTVGGSHLYAFVGMKGPYWQDSNNDGLITNADTPMSGSVGLAIKDFSFGLAIMKPTSPIDPSKYFALKATAKDVSLVGVSGVTATAQDLTVELNQSKPAVYGVPAFPVVNFAAMPGGKYSIPTGGIDPATNAPVTVDLTMNSPLVRAEGFVSLNISGAIYINGSAAFELGPQKSVTLSDGSTKSVMTMSVGVANASAFIGANGPYWTDTNKNRVVDTGETSASAIGFSVTNFTGGLLVMASTNLGDLGAYVGLKASVTGVGLVNMPAGITVSGAFDVEANLGVSAGSGLAAVNFLTSFPAEGSNPAGYSVRTGPTSPPVLLNFTGPKLDIKLQGTLGLSSAFGITGTFFFDISPSQLKVLADGQVTIAAGNFFNLQGVGVLIINKSGAAADIDVSIAANVPGLSINAGARLMFNTTGIEQTITIPQKYVAGLSSTTQARLQTDASGNKYYGIAAGAPLFDGTTGPAEPYIVVKANGSLTIASTFALTGDFQVILSASQVSLRVQASASLGGAPAVSVTGGLQITSAGLVGIIQGGIDASTPPQIGPGFELTLIASFEINTTSSAVTEIAGIQLQSTLPAMTVRAGGLGKLRFTLSSVAEFVLEGNFQLTAGASGSGIAQTAVFSGTLSANIGSLTLLKVNASGTLGIYEDANAGIAGSIQVTVNSNTQTGGSGFNFTGNFKLFVNTTGIARTIGTESFAAGPYVRLHIDGYMQLTIAGVEAFRLGSGTFDLVAGVSGFMVAIDADVPIMAGPVKILDLHTTGALLINSQGLAAKLSLTPKANSPLGGIGYRFAPNTNFTLEVNTTSSSVTIDTGAAVVSVAASGEAGITPRMAALTIGLPAGPYVQIRAEGALYVGVSGALEMEMAGTAILTVSSAGLAFTVTGNLNLTVAGATLITFTINQGALLVTANGIAAKASLGVAISNVPGLSFSGDFVWELNTTGQAIPVINDVSVNLAAGPYVRVKGQGTLTLAGFVPINGGFDFSIASDHIELSLNASIKIFSSSLTLITTGGIYANGVAFSVSIGTKIDLVSNIEFRGTFAVRVNTTGDSHFGISGNTVEIRVDDLRADFLGLEASGSLIIRVVDGSFQFEVPSSNPLRISFFGIVSLDFSGYFHSFSDWSFTGHFGFGFDIGIAAASFDASLTIGSGDPFHFHFSARFHGEVLGGLASFTLTGSVDVGGGGDGLIRLGGSVEVSIDFGFFDISFDVPFSFTFGRLSISLPPILGHVEADGTLVLHVGADAGLRLRSTTDDDENFLVEHVGGVAGNETVRVTALGVSQDYTNVKRVVVRDAGNGSDTIEVKGGVLADAELNGGVGSDTLTYSGAGRAVIRGGSGNDKLTGGNGNDVLEGGDGADQLYGNGGNDTLRGGAGNDYLGGGDGNDLLYGDGGDDRLEGGQGNDVYYFSAGFGLDTLVETATGGTDRIDFSNADTGAVSSGLTFTFSTSETKVVYGSNSVTHGGNNLEQIVGGRGDDAFVFSDNVTVAGYVHGGAGGNDTLNLSAYTGSLTWNVTANAVGTSDVDNTHDEGFVGRTGGYAMPFESIENLVSGTGDDFFVFANGMGLNGSADGGRGIDRFDFSAYASTGLRINIGDQLTAGAAGVVNARSSTNVGNGTAERVLGFEHVWGGAGNDVIVGNSVNDYAGANTGRNILIGNGGDDTIFGVGGSDILLGDAGNVAIQVDGTLNSIAGANVTSGGNDILDGGDGVDYVIGGFGADKISGGTANDLIFGDNGNITFAAGLPTLAETGTGDAGGNDTINGDDGDDLLVGGMGADTINGGAGKDFILGDGGAATFSSSLVITRFNTTTANAGGADTIDGGAGANVIFGGAAGDSITGGADADIVVGDSGRAEFNAGGFVTLVVTTDSGVGGNDTLSLGGGDNIAFGGTGADKITTGDARDIIVGDNGSATFDTSTHFLTNIQTANPSDAGADTINAGNGNNVVLGGTANDTITTGSGADIVIGDNGAANFYASTGILQNVETNTPTSVGNDVINAGTGSDVILGGGGADQIDAGSVGDTSRDIVIGDSGHADFDSSGNLTLAYTTIPDSGSDDTITLGGGDNVAFGGAASDTITGGDGNDIIVGDNGSATFDTSTHVVIDVHTTDPASGSADVINAANGNNIVLGGTENDSITTGTGADVIVGDNGTALFYSTGILKSIETSDPNNGGNDTINSGTGADVIFGGSGSDIIDAGSSGDTSRDVVVGDNGHADFDSAGYLTLVYTTVPATGGNDTITLGGGDNIAFGGVGDDTITGGSDNDIIVGDNGSATFHATAHTLANVHTTDASIGGSDIINAGNGNNIVIGGAAGDEITTGTGDDIALGDNGLVDYVVNDGDPGDIDLISSTDFGIGGADTISTGAGADLVVGGAAGDTIDAGNGNNIVFGDSAEILAAIANAPNFSTQPLTIGRLRTLAPGIGGDDSITTGTDRDTIFGGTGADTIVANDGETASLADAGNIILGDDGFIDYVRAEREPTALGGDTNPADIDLISSSDSNDGGADHITTGNGSDIVIAGQGADTITTGNGVNLVLGDSGIITAATENGNRFAAHPLTVGRVETTAFGVGGADTITSGTGNDLIFGGEAGDTIDAGQGDNVVLGDDGAIDWVRQERDGATPGADLSAADIDLILSLSTTAAGGADTITTGSGNDIVIGGRAGDTINAGAGNNLIVGDSGKLTAANEDANRFGSVGLTVGRIETIEFGDGGVDTITTLEGHDVILGGHLGDTINAGDGDNVVLGDDGAIDYARSERDGATPGADTDAADIDLIVSLSTTAAGGADTITTGSGNDIVIGGRFGDTINAGTGNNVVIADSGRMIAANSDASRFNRPGSTLITFGRIETTTPGDGGDDTVKSGIGRDIVLGGPGADTITANDGETGSVADTDNIVLGDDGYIDFTRVERDGNLLGADTDPSDIDVIASSDFADGGADIITTGNGSDIIIAGQANDRINAGNGSNIVIGDSGIVTAANENVNRFASQPLAPGRMESTAFGIGGVDTITTGSGNDIVIGGEAGDSINAGDGDNIVAGDDVAIEYVRQEREALAAGAKPGADLSAGDIDYITSISTTAAGGADTITTGSGHDIVLGGRFGDTITAGAGNNIVIGDSGLITAANENANRFGSLGLTVGRIETIEFGDGGIDNVTTLGGNDLILGGHLGDFINAGDGDNVVLGDDGAIDNVRSERDGTTPGADTTAADIDLIVSLSTTAAGGADTITTGSGNDIVIGGRFGDTVNAGEGDNVVIGDSGTITAANEIANRFSSQTNTTLTIGLIETMTYGDGGADNITTGAGIDIILGGHDADTINGGNGDNVVLGDDGLIDYVRLERSATTPGADVNAADIDFILSTSTKFAGGADTITTGSGNDIIIGGRYGDTINGGAGRNIVLGDSGRITAANEDANRFATYAITVGLIETITPDDGGIDTITTLGGNDVILGGHLGDTIDAGDGDNVVLGDDGLIDYVRVERDGVRSGADTNAADIDYILSLSTTANGGVDRITTGSGNDIIIGGRFGDTIVAGNGNNIVVGDSAEITAVNEDAPRFGTQFITVGRIETIQTEDGGNDEIRTGSGQDVVIGGAGSDRLDAGAGDDLVIGDNEVLDRTGRVNNFTSPLFEALRGTLIYDSNGNLLVNGVPANQPGGSPIWGDMTLTLLDHSFAVQAAPNNRFGNDTIAGGAGNDRIFGGLGNDVIQGDGSIDIVVSARRLADGTLQVTGSVEAASDGDDYIEGNGGDDLIFGGLGQDDIIGGSSDFFGLTTHDQRPDGSDLIFGGAGTRIGREDAGDTSATGRGRDADTIIGDNGRVIRLVGINNVAGTAYLGFNYDIYGALKIVARGVDFLDYTPGGIDLSANAANDIGAADEIHGEGGNDTIYGQLGNDVLFGDAQDDDIIGGTGADWISAGNGEDGVLGDDGRIFTSRNGTVEPLYGIAAIPEGGLNLVISTPGQMQLATINVAGQLKRTVVLEPFDLTSQPTLTPKTASNDIIFGGLGSDSLHGGAGDDAISGAEALSGYFAKPLNPGDILRWGQVRPGEFAAYDEYNPRTKIYVNPTTFEFTSSTTPGAVEFILNFIATEQDGDDVIFGDSGNDWLVGGMGRDHVYGGYGDDLLNADDNHDTNGGLNTSPDGPDANQEDLAYGGAGRDILIGNTAGDRLIDWAGEFNSYIVPFANFGAATISRTLQPQLAEFLYDLSQSDGADHTRAAKTGSAVDRNGEPEGELGLVRQQDFDWGAQTGAPADPQPGNIPGGRRDVLRSANFNNATADGFAPDSGTWQVVGGRLQVAPSAVGGEAVSVFYVDAVLPRYYEIQATINAVKPTAGYKANGYVVFDYFSPTDFKFAGIDVATNKIVIGHRTATSWIVDASANLQAKAGTDYNMLVSVNGLTATLVIDNKNVLSFSFGPRVVGGYSYNLNTGMVGVAGDNSRVEIDNVAVQVLPPTFTFQNSEDFSDGVANLLKGDQVGAWSIAGGRDTGTPGATGFAASNFNFGLGANSLLQIDATLRIGSVGASAGVVFDYYNATNFKFAAVVAGTNQVVIGHYNKNTWTIDATASRTVAAGTDYALSIVLKGTTVSVNINGQAALGYAFNAVVTDGQAGLFTRGGASSFSSYLVKTDDPKMAGVVIAGATATASTSDSVGAAMMTADVTATLSASAGVTQSVALTAEGASGLSLLSVTDSTLRSSQASF